LLHGRFGFKDELRFPDLAHMTSPDLVMQALDTLARMAFDTLRDKSKRRGADLTIKVAPAVQSHGAPSGVCGFPGIIISPHCQTKALAKAMLIRA
jgi:hypothetical protein